MTRLFGEKGAPRHLPNSYSYLRADLTLFDRGPGNHSVEWGQRSPNGATHRMRGLKVTGDLGLHCFISFAGSGAEELVEPSLACRR